MQRGARGSISSMHVMVLLCSAVLALVWSAPTSQAQQTAACPQLRKINIGISTTPPNVVHTTPHVAKALGLFAKHCIEANLLQFEGGQSVAALAAITQGTAITNINDAAIGRGAKAIQIWGFAPRMPQSYVVSPTIKTPADLKGRKLSASGGGVGGYQWRMGREVLRRADLKVEDAQFISQTTAGRLAGIMAGMVDGVALPPEDVFLALRDKPGAHVLVEISDLVPNYVYNMYGASIDWLARERPLLRDTIAAMIEANRIMYRDKEKVVPLIVAATEKPKEAVEFALNAITSKCVWGVNEGFNAERTRWTINNNVEAGDLDEASRPTVERVFDIAFAREAVEAAGGRTAIGQCTE